MPVAKFNLKDSEIEALEELAKTMHTTVTGALQTAIRDEVFIQERLAVGETFAVILPTKDQPRRVNWGSR